MKPQIHKPKWPEMPYKGFSYYGPDDMPLFAGRDKEIVEFSRIVGDPDARVILLHGATGCGKSSFLRAGVIPFLESGFRGFGFIKDTEDQIMDKTGEASGVREAKAVFVRSTSNPYEKLSDAIFHFASKRYEFDSPFGRESVDLKPALRNCDTTEKFMGFVAESPKLLVEALENIAIQLPTKLVLIVDQAEEVLTLGAGEYTERARERFFSFLGTFSDRQLPIRLILALRTEHHGVFQARIKRASRGRIQLEDYLLESFGEPDLRRAILRPTEQVNVGVFGRPYDVYRFSFEHEVPRRITRDLENIVEAGGLIGGALPVLQVVCETLYKTTMPRGSNGQTWVITQDDYSSLGPLQTQLGDYVDGIIGGFLQKQDLSRTQVENQTFLWKDLLTALAKTQIDSTVTTDLKTVDELREVAETLGVKYFEGMVAYLADDNQSVLRREMINRLGAREPIECFSLRHDAIGLVLDRWRTARESFRHTIGALRRLVTGLILVMSLLYLCHGMFVVWQYLKNPTPSKWSLSLPVLDFTYFAFMLRILFKRRSLLSEIGFYRIAILSDGREDVASAQDPVFRLLKHSSSKSRSPTLLVVRKVAKLIRGAAELLGGRR